MLKRKQLSIFRVKTLLKNSNYEEEILSYLYDNHMLDDLRYCETYISSYIYKDNVSRKKLFLDLLNEEIPEYLIEEALLKSGFDELENALKFANKRLRNYRKESEFMCRSKIKQSLLKYLFSLETINEVLKAIEVDEISNASYFFKENISAIELEKLLRKKYFKQETIKELLERCGKDV